MSGHQIFNATEDKKDFRSQKPHQINIEHWRKVIRGKMFCIQIYTSPCT